PHSFSQYHVDQKKDTHVKICYPQLHSVTFALYVFDLQHHRTFAVSKYDTMLYSPSHLFLSLISYSLYRILSVKLSTTAVFQLCMSFNVSNNLRKACRTQSLFP